MIIFWENVHLNVRPNVKCCQQITVSVVGVETGFSAFGDPWQLSSLYKDSGKPQRALVACVHM